MQVKELKSYLTKRGLTQSKLGVLMELSTNTINSKLNGKIPIKVEEAEKLTKILGIENPNNIFFGM